LENNYSFRSTYWLCAIVRKVYVISQVADSGFSLRFNLSVSYGGFVMEKVTVEQVCAWEYDFILSDIVSSMLPH
jgi:hypothetical protein